MCARAWRERAEGKRHERILAYSARVSGGGVGSSSLRKAEVVCGGGSFESIVLTTLPGDPIDAEKERGRERERDGVDARLLCVSFCCWLC